MTEQPFDAVVIGAGVVGCAIARDLSRYQLRLALVDSAADVGTGTSKANTSVLHTGFDAIPGSLEARLIRRGYERLVEYAQETGIPMERTGAVLVAWDEEQADALPAIQERAIANGYDETQLRSRDELYALEPRLGDGALSGLDVPGEGIVCTFSTTLALAYDAVENDVELLLESEVIGVHASAEGHHVLEFADGRRLAARWVINAAGLHADEVDRLFGYERIRVTPRRGELIVFDKFARALVDRILLPVPNERTKGVLVAPTVFGNVLLGPTAEDVGSKDATGSTASGIAFLLERGRQIVPSLVEEEITAIYAGLRAATDSSDYVIESEPTQRYVCIAGIRSTGLTACLGASEHVVELLQEGGLATIPKDDLRAITMPRIGEACLRPYRDLEAIRANPEYGHLICHCERVSLGEIEDALRAPVRARTLDGVQRRTRAQFGRCQGFYCSAAVAELLDRAHGPLPHGGSAASGR